MYCKKIIILNNVNKENSKITLCLEQIGSNLNGEVKFFNYKTEADLVLGIMLGGFMLSPIHLKKFHNFEKGFKFALNGKLDLSSEIVAIVADKANGPATPIFYGSNAGKNEDKFSGIISKISGSSGIALSAKTEALKTKNEPEVKREIENHKTIEREIAFEREPVKENKKDDEYHQKEYKEEKASGAYDYKEEDYQFNNEEQYKLNSNNEDESQSEWVKQIEEHKTWKIYEDDRLIMANAKEAEPIQSELFKTDDKEVEEQIDREIEYEYNTFKDASNFMPESIIDLPKEDMQDENVCLLHDKEFIFPDDYDKEVFAFNMQEPKAPNFFNLISGDLETLFLTYPEEPTFYGVFPNSKFVHIDYSPTGLFYCLGIIYGADEPAEIVYAVPASVNAPIPKEVENSAKWLPLPYTTKQGKTYDGFYVMYQSAKTGEAI